MNDLARPKKYGLEYFPLDVGAGIDDEIELLEAAHKLEGFAIFIKLLQSIYKNGYYINWTKKEQLIFTKRVNTEENLVNDVITSCLEWGLFDKAMYENQNILTSHGIQQRFLFAIGRRSSVEIFDEYLLLSKNEVNAAKNLVIVSKTHLDCDNNTQIKEKEKESIIVASDHTTDIRKILENGFGRLVSPIEVETLLSYLDDGIQLDLIEKAVREAAINGVKKINYVKRILNRCVDQKINTLEHYQLAQKEFKEKISTNDTQENREPYTDEMKRFLEEG